MLINVIATATGAQEEDLELVFVVEVLAELLKGNVALADLPSVPEREVHAFCDLRLLRGTRLREGEERYAQVDERVPVPLEGREALDDLQQLKRDLRVV